MQQVVADSTDPATTRPDLDPTTQTGTGFIPMDLPPFAYAVNLPPEIKPIDAWGIFLLFFPQEQMQIICENTNKRRESDQESCSKTSRLHAWVPMTVPEAYGYLGIRIYMGIHREDRIPYYWKPGSESWPSHPMPEVMSLRRFEAIHTAFRLCTADPDHDFRAVFDRVRTFY